MLKEEEPGIKPPMFNSVLSGTSMAFVVGVRFFKLLRGYVPGCES
jgi:hypothetical protein